MISVSDLLALAEEALAEHAGLDQDIAAVTAYSEAFQSWQAEGAKAGKAELGRLNEKHRRLVEKAAGLQQVAHRDLGAFRKKTKGLKAYLGGFPAASRKSRSKKG